MEAIEHARGLLAIGAHARAMQAASDAVQTGDANTAAAAGSIFARACIGAKQFPPLRKMQQSNVPGERAAALYALATLSKGDAQRSAARADLKALVESSQDAHAAQLFAAAAAGADDWAAAGEVLERVFGGREAGLLALAQAALLLSINRPELVDSSVGDDAAAQVNKVLHMIAGRGDLTGAFEKLCDIQTEFDEENAEVPSSLLLNLKVACNLLRVQPAEAIEELQHATDKTDPATAGNLACAAAMSGDDAQFAEATKLVAASPDSLLANRLRVCEAAFAQFQ